MVVCSILCLLQAACGGGETTSPEAQPEPSVQPAAQIAHEPEHVSLAESEIPLNGLLLAQWTKQSGSYARSKNICTWQAKRSQSSVPSSCRGMFSRQRKSESLHFV